MRCGKYENKQDVWLWKTVVALLKIRNGKKNYRIATMKLSSYPLFNSSFGMWNKKFEKEVLRIFDVEDW